MKVFGMSMLNDIVAFLISMIFSSVVFIPDIPKIILSSISLMLIYFFFKYVNKYASLFISIPFILLFISKYYPWLYDVSLLSLFIFLIYSFFYSVHSRMSSKNSITKFKALETKIKDFLNILIAFDYLPYEMKIFDELTNYMVSIFPEIYSITIFEKTPMGWLCKSSKNLSKSFDGVYLKNIDAQTLKPYFFLDNSDIFILNIELEGDIYSITYNLIEEPDDRELMEYFLKTLLILSLKFEKKYFLGLENALIAHNNIISFDVYRTFSQTILEIASKAHSNVVFALIEYNKDLNDFSAKIFPFIEPSDLAISIDSNSVLLVFPKKSINECKIVLNKISEKVAFAQYPDDGLTADSILKNLKRKLFLKRAENEFVQ